MRDRWDHSRCNPPVNVQNKTDGQSLIHLALLAKTIEAGGDLTEETIREWFVRISIVEEINGFGYEAFLGDVLTCLRRFVGLRVNGDQTPRERWIEIQLAKKAESVAWRARCAEDRFDFEAPAADAQAGPPMATTTWKDIAADLLIDLFGEHGDNYHPRDIFKPSVLTDEHGLPPSLLTVKEIVASNAPAGTVLFGDDGKEVAAMQGVVVGDLIDAIAEGLGVAMPRNAPRGYSGSRLQLAAAIVRHLKAAV